MKGAMVGAKGAKDGKAKGSDYGRPQVCDVRRQ